MVKKQKPDIKVNHIRELYLEIKSMNPLMTPEQVLSNDVTERFWMGIILGRRHREIINMAIRGKTGSSKSTTATKVLYVLVKQMIKDGIIPQMTEKELQEYLFTRISSDQTEFLRFAMKEKGQTVAVIDEFSTMGETGFNATTEQAMYTEHSDLFAQDYIHKISCSPSYINDKNADIILDFVGIDDKKRISQFKLSYRDVIEQVPYPLGIVNIYVGDVIKMDFYRRYRLKKFKRLDLLKKHGIRNVRELEFSIITMEVYKILREAATTRKQTQDLMLSIVDMVRREKKMQLSILTLNFMVVQVKSILDLVYEISQYDKRIPKTEEEKEKIQRVKVTLTELLTRRLKEENEKIVIEQQYRETQ